MLLNVKILHFIFENEHFIDFVVFHRKIATKTYLKRWLFLAYCDYKYLPLKQNQFPGGFV